MRAVDRTVVEGETGLHRRPGGDRTVCEHDRPVADSTDPEQAALRRIEDRGRDVDRMDAAVRDGERPIGEVVGRQRVIAGTRRELGDARVDLADREPVGAGDHRRDDSVVGIDRNGNVDLA